MVSQRCKLLVIFQRTLQLARTEEQGIKGHNARGCKTAPGGMRFARTTDGPGTEVTSVDCSRRRVRSADDSRRQEGGRGRSSAARSAAVRHTPAVKVPSSPLPKPHSKHGPRLPLRTWGRLHGFPSKGPLGAASAGRPGQA